ncbi:molybdopterin-guanine dinucleotide biosynthesis protein B [Candidatus Bathyarchaeota archaeon]|nr:molybdopterin-guanine dinucleotide biosynthesis protein B [Candidatus Bathyarchaeota archaeon]
MRSKIPILAVLGRKSSGKTTVIEHLVSELLKRGFSVATSKHISHRDFSIDTKGSDTWRHSSAGANPVIAVSSNEMSIIVKMKSPKIEVIPHLVQSFGANILILEGFSSMVMDDKSVGKIICVRSLEEYKEFMESARGNVIAFCSFQEVGKPVIKISEDFPILTEKTLGFIERRLRILRILDSLAGLDCGKCGRKTCEEMAEKIYLGEASMDECFPLRIKSELSTRVSIDGRDVPLQPFVSEFMRKTVLGMISSLKNVSIKGDEEIRIEVKGEKKSI